MEKKEVLIRKFESMNALGKKGFIDSTDYSIISDSIEIQKAVYTYEQIYANYSCANSSSGSSPIFTYTGNCQIINDGNGNWRVKFISNGTLTVSNPFDVDLFLVGGGAGNGGYGGTNSVKKGIELNSTRSYTVTIGAGSTSSGGTTVFGDYSTAGGTSSSGGIG